MKINKKENLIILEKKELILLCKKYSADVYAEEIYKKINENKQNTLKHNIEETFKEVAQLKRKLLIKENIEFVTSLIFTETYKNDFLIGFRYKLGINIDKTLKKIINEENLKDLIDVLEENTDCDFAIISNNENIIQRYQLKQCRLRMNTESLFNYIQKKISDYGNNLGDTNIIFLAQGDSTYQQSQEIINIGQIHSKIKKLNYSFNGNILILRYDKEDLYIYEVYPDKNLQKKTYKFEEIIYVSEEMLATALQKFGL